MRNLNHLAYELPKKYVCVQSVFKLSSTILTRRLFLKDVPFIYKIKDMQPGRHVLQLI